MPFTFTIPEFINQLPNLAKVSIELPQSGQQEPKSELWTLAITSGEGNVQKI